MQKKYVYSFWIAGLLMLTLWGCFKKKSNSEEEGSSNPGIPVKVMTPVPRDVELSIQTIALLGPSLFVAIESQLTGQLEHIFVKEGEWVKPGDALFEISSKPYLTKLHIAQAQLEIHQATLETIQKKMARFEGLVQKNLISAVEWEALGQELIHAKASVEMSLAQVSQAQLDFELCTLRSNMEAKIGKIDVAVGSIVGPGKILTTLSKLDPLTVEFTVTEKEFAKIPQTISYFKVEALVESIPTPGSAPYALVTFIDDHFDAKTGLLIIRGSLDNKEMRFRPGHSVRVNIPIKTLPGSLLVPQKAIRHNEDGPYLFVVEKNKVAQRFVTLGEEDKDDVIVLNGLSSKDEVITDGHLRLTVGSEVTVKP